jgi:hypothetical protein
MHFVCTWAVLHRTIFRSAVLAKRAETAIFRSHASHTLWPVRNEENYKSRFHCGISPLQRVGKCVSRASLRRTLTWSDCGVVANRGDLPFLSSTIVYQRVSAANGMIPFGLGPRWKCGFDDEV